MSVFPVAAIIHAICAKGGEKSAKGLNHFPQLEK
jgi:hypothetical protein